MENEAHNSHGVPNRGAHVLVLPYPLQGHINPILQFAKRLAYKGLKLTVLVPSSISKRTSLENKHHPFSLDFIQIFDGYEDIPDKRDLAAYLSRLRNSTSRCLLELLDHYKQNNKTLNPTPKMVIYDSLMPWVLDVVRKVDGLEGAPFFTQSCVVNSIYYHFYEGALKRPIVGSDLVSLPCIKSLLQADDLPSFVTSPGVSYPVALMNMIFDQFTNLKDVDCLFVNTLDKLEIEVVRWMQSTCPVKTIGPCIPSKYLDNCIPDDVDYGLNLFQPETNACVQWLNSRHSKSVVYVSMGSMASLEKEQMQEIARGLAKSNKYFLWVIRASEESKLPLNFKQETLEKGLIVSWCPQLEVLAHQAIGCFVTHCGWNSTLEAISLGVPMVGFPQWSDQPTNAKCIKNIWRTGARVRANENGLMTKDEIARCIQEVLEGKKSQEIRCCANKWKEFARATMEDGGTSASNIQEFVAKLKYV